MSTLERFILYSVAVIVWSQIAMKQTGDGSSIHFLVLLLLGAGWLKSFSALARAALRVLKDRGKSAPASPKGQ